MDISFNPNRTTIQNSATIPPPAAHADTAGAERAALRVTDIRTCDGMLGANPLGLSWIVGLGERTIRAPLHNSRYRPESFVVVGTQALDMAVFGLLLPDAP